MTLLLSLHHKKLMPYSQRGFSLVEMAIVLVILGFLLGGLMMPLTSQREAQQRAEAQKQLEDIRNAIIGFAQVNSRLPCPASPTSNGVSSPNVPGACTGTDLVPHVTLGIKGTADGGRLLDPWHQPLRYHLTPAYSATITSLSNAPQGNFTICDVSTPSVCPAARTTANNVVAVLFSTGETNSPSPNPVSTTNIHSSTPTYTFDDVVVWISQPELIYALSRAR